MSRPVPTACRNINQQHTHHIRQRSGIRCRDTEARPFRLTSHRTALLQCWTNGPPRLFPPLLSQALMARSQLCQHLLKQRMPTPLPPVPSAAQAHSRLPQVLWDRTRVATFPGHRSCTKCHDQSPRRHIQIHHGRMVHFPARYRASMRSVPTATSRRHQTLMSLRLWPCPTRCRRGNEPKRRTCSQDKGTARLMRNYVLSVNVAALRAGDSTTQ